MSQTIFSQDDDSVKKAYANVGENWKLYDTVLIGRVVPSLDFNTGWFATYAAMGAANMVPFFNVRNRNHGIAYNNQDVRDQMPYVYEIYAIGVRFFAPSTSTFDTYAPILGEQTIVNNLFEIELPKHMSMSLRTNQDERLLTNCLMAPGGYGVVGGGVAQGDPETDYTYPNLQHSSFSQGVPHRTNVWGFPKPLKIPRTANLSVEIRLSPYAIHLLTNMLGPMTQPVLDVAGDGTYFPADSVAGIQVTLQGERFVQQRGQYHA